MNHPFLHTIDPTKLTLPHHLQTLHTWIDGLQGQFEGDAPAPRATLLCGIPGSGKGIVAGAIAFESHRMFYRLDPACDAFAVAEIVGLLAAMPQTVLLVDEPGEQHRGLLQWLLDQPERTVFLVATTMRPNKLPAGFFRRDVFDTAWHLDLPTQRERCMIWSQHLELHGPPVSGYDCVRLAQCSPRCTYGEIRAKHDSVVRAAQGKVPSMNDFLGAAIRHRPLAHDLDDEVALLREWSVQRAERAGIAAPAEEFD